MSVELAEFSISESVAIVLKRNGEVIASKSPKGLLPDPADALKEAQALGRFLGVSVSAAGDKQILLKIPLKP